MTTYAFFSQTPLYYARWPSLGELSPNPVSKVMGRDVFEKDVFAHLQPTTVYLQILDNTTFTARQSCDSALKLILEEHEGGFSHSFCH